MAASIEPGRLQWPLLWRGGGCGRRRRPVVRHRLAVARLAVARLGVASLGVAGLGVTGLGVDGLALARLALGLRPAVRDDDARHPAAFDLRDAGGEIDDQLL